MINNIVFIPDCEQRFQYTFDGWMQVVDKNDKAARTTIKTLNLSCAYLSDKRKQVIDTFLYADVDNAILLEPEDTKKLVKRYLKKNNGRYNPFYTTIKSLFSA